MTTALPAHAPSYYAATAVGLRERPRLDGSATADVCIVGGGFTGLSAALHLAERGRKVVLLEAKRLGWGATGRNGGQLHTGQRRPQDWIEARFGREEAHRLWSLAEDAKALVFDLAARHDIACDLTPGLIHALHRESEIADEKASLEHMRAEYGYDKLDFLSREELRAAIGTDFYAAGSRDRGAAHLHPLSFALGLAAAAERAGAQLYEGSPVKAVRQGRRFSVETTTGTIEADDVLLAGNGYLAGIEPTVEARVLPIKNYVLATAPLKNAAEIIPGNECIADSRFVVRYWRLTADGRMLFGGGETYGNREPADLKGFVRRYMLELYPGLADTPIDYAWGGTLAVTRERMPMVRRVRPGLYAATGYSGQGVAIAPFAGKLVADAIAGETDGLDIFSRIPVPPFPGGTLLRKPLMILAMLWFAMRDRM
ncbi:NAD(P)/FAD-dependent oxidoreductase [Segnochrobactrum spirostomi]|uniref:FAD-binding oxidoreductase n=1 Tax=Segnochrobactrum spirostomi TaxID=2608987 RepID=A0A6A7XYI2_9HYPH|nr:FAD-binding oxidoreductase [Segnochrobactrum spirostomi]MQT11346.1 FAD-binding oxidoreductase [Segnochrobactrum spirostomi]